MPGTPFKITRYGIVGNLTGSVEGTASVALEAVSASYALTASHALNVKDLPLETGSAPYSVQSTTASVASGTASFAHGDNVTASGVGSHAEGFNAVASGESSHAEGTWTNASGSYSHAEGEFTEASGYSSHAEGSSTKASGYSSHAEGQSTEASEYGSHAEGDNTVASGEYSHAEGEFTEASGLYSHTEGSNTKASGYSSHAEGQSTEASENYSHAEGYYTKASEGWSHAEGYETIASNQYEHAQGIFNATASSQIFSIGAGDAEARRKNAISIITGSGAVPSASVCVYGIGGYDGTNPQPGTNDLKTTIETTVTRVESLEEQVPAQAKTTQPAGGMLPNVLYELGTLTGSVTFTLAAGTSGRVNHYYWTFDTGDTAPTITWPAAVTSWLGGTPLVVANKHYEISVLDGVGVYMEV